MVYNLAAIQMVSVSSPEINLSCIKKLLEKLSPVANQLVLLPENALSFSDKSGYLSLAENLGEGYYQTQLGLLAKQHQCYLVCGSFPIKIRQSAKIFSTSLVFSPQGKLISHYHKIHLFDALLSDQKGRYKESDTFMAGDEIQLFDYQMGSESVKVGLAICYDLRFPALFQMLRAKGADIILLPAAFTKVTGAGHWFPLLQARAIENQCYIIAANQGGLHPCGRETYGHSVIISPWGELLSQLELGEGVVQASFDKQFLERIRLQMPVTSHNRFSNSLVK
ncbi:MAG: putative amidohydrolase [Psychromonas sp.]|jgi:predicted amidohydrolase|uniref:carbon-nitrogen hydrolase family protein n=1 Tax=Psychromonas sp. TaxID=1884585 RepID=UPI0039E65FD9